MQDLRLEYKRSLRASRALPEAGGNLRHPDRLLDVEETAELAAVALYAGVRVEGKLFIMPRRPFCPVACARAYFIRPASMSFISCMYLGMSKPWGQWRAQEAQPMQAPGCFSAGRRARLASRHAPPSLASL